MTQNNDFLKNFKEISNNEMLRKMAENPEEVQKLSDAAIRFNRFIAEELKIQEIRTTEQAIDCFQRIITMTAGKWMFPFRNAPPEIKIAAIDQLFNMCQHAIDINAFTSLSNADEDLKEELSLFTQKSREKENKK